MLCHLLNRHRENFAFLFILICPFLDYLLDSSSRSKWLDWFVNVKILPSYDNLDCSLCLMVFEHSQCLARKKKEKSYDCIHFVLYANINISNTHYEENTCAHKSARFPSNKSSFWSPNRTLYANQYWYF